VLSVSGGTNGSSNWFSVLNNNDKEVFSAYTDNDGDGVVNIKNKLAANKIALNSAGASYFNGGDLGVGETSPNAKLDVNGTTRLGDSETNYVAVGATGNQSFAGSAGFYPRTLAQDAEPAAGTGATQVDSGEFVIWVDTNDSNKVYGVYNYGGAVVTILLT